MLTESVNQPRRCNTTSVVECAVQVQWHKCALQLSSFLLAWTAPRFEQCLTLPLFRCGALSWMPPAQVRRLFARAKTFMPVVQSC